MDTVLVLPAADGVRWLAARYSLFHPDSAATSHATPDLTGAALYSAPNGGSAWRLEWIGAEPYGMIYRITPELALRPDGSAFVGVEYCVNGTAGCWQEYLARRRGRWYQVYEAWRQQLPAIPSGSVGKGSGVDVATLIGSYGFYGPNDANCCPERELLVTLALRRDSLVLVRHEVRPYRQ